MPHLDAAEKIFVERALEYIEAEVYNTEIPPLEGRRFVPVDNSAPAGAKATTYRQYTRTGVARLVTERGKDLPTVGLFVKEFSRQFQRLGASYEYTRDDVLAAAMALRNGQAVNLDPELAIAAREAIEKGLDEIAAFGTGGSIGPDVGMIGLLNLPNANTYVVPSGAGVGATQAWETKTPDEIVADLNGICSGQIAATYKLYSPRAILLPISKYELIAGKRMGDGSDETVLSHFMKVQTAKMNGVRMVDSWQPLTTAGSGSTTRMIAYTPERRFVRHMIAEEFTTLPVQEEGFEYKVPCTAKTAGVVCPYPLSVSYGDGI